MDPEGRAEDEGNQRERVGIGAEDKDPLAHIVVRHQHANQRGDGRQEEQDTHDDVADEAADLVMTLFLRKGEHTEKRGTTRVNPTEGNGLLQGKRVEAFRD